MTSPRGLVARWRAVLAAAADPRLLPIDVRVLVAILDRANSETGEAWPAVKTIAAESATSERSVPRSTRRLVETGHLVSRVVVGSSNRYSLPSTPPTPATHGTPDTRVTPDMGGSDPCQIVQSPLPRVSPDLAFDPALDPEEPSTATSGKAVTMKELAAIWETYERDIRLWLPHEVTTDGDLKALAKLQRIDKRTTRASWWHKVFGYCGGNPLFMGDTTKRDGREFHLSLSWLLKVKNYKDAIEGGAQGFWRDTSAAAKNDDGPSWLPEFGRSARA